MDCNKDSAKCDTRVSRFTRRIRERVRPSARDFRRHMVRGAGYALGSWGVGILIIWIQTR